MRSQPKYSGSFRKLNLAELSRQCLINKAPYGILVAHYEALPGQYKTIACQNEFSKRAIGLRAANRDCVVPVVQVERLLFNDTDPQTGFHLSIGPSWSSHPDLNAALGTPALKKQWHGMSPAVARPRPA